MATDSSTILTLALQLLMGRVLLILALGMTFGLYCWSMWAHSWIALAIAGAFSIVVFLPVLMKQGNSNAKDSS